MEAIISPCSVWAAPDQRALVLEVPGNSRRGDRGSDISAA